MSGLAARVRRHADALIVAGVLVGIGGANLFWTSHEIRAQEASQARQGQIVERKLCSTFAGLAALQPPAGSPVDNPSRAYLQEQHARLAQVGPDIGCGGQGG